MYIYICWHIYVYTYVIIHDYIYTNIYIYIYVYIWYTWYIYVHIYIWCVTPAMSIRRVATMSIGWHTVYSHAPARQPAPSSRNKGVPAMHKHAGSNKQMGTSWRGWKATSTLAHNTCEHEARAITYPRSWSSNVHSKRAHAHCTYQSEQKNPGYQPCQTALAESEKAAAPTAWCHHTPIGPFLWTPAGLRNFTGF